MKSFATVLILSLISFAGYTQVPSSAISGFVKDSRNEPIGGATVQLLNAGDSARIKSMATSENGKFLFSNTKIGSYRLVITAIGQKKFISAAFRIDSMHNTISMPAIIMLPAKNTTLEEVVVKARKPLIVQEIDKTVVNVESMISSTSSNALEVLEKTPGVTVTSNGDISLNGRGGILVLIDGRSTYMSGQDLAAYLKSLPGGLLDKIELMDNPPARYDAAGNAIINIRLKKNRAGGFTGNVSTGYTQGKYGRNNDALNLNYNYKKINLFANTGFNKEKNYTDDVYDRRFYNTTGEQSSSVLLTNNQLYKSNGFSLNLGADYTASTNTSFGVIANINTGKSNGTLSSSSTNYNQKNQVDSTGNGSTEIANNRKNLGVNFNMLHKFGKTGRELSAEINYLHYNNGGNQVLQNFVYQPGGAFSSNSFLYLLPATISIYTAKADYVHPLKNNMRLEAGFKSSIVDNDNTATYYKTTGQVQTIDNNQSNHFLYHENINAAYVNSQAKWKRFGAQLGLRIENTKATGHQLGNDAVKESRFTKDYTKLFPSVFLSYKLDTVNKNSLTFSVTRRIGRPNYQLLNPFVFMRDQYTYIAGNPDLNPQYQYRYELRWQHKQFLRMGLSYNRFTDVNFQITQAVGNIFITMPNNVAKGYMLLLNTSVNIPVTKWWTLNSDILLSKAALNGMAYTEVLNPSVFMARINLLNQFQFSKGWSAEAGSYFASKDLQGQAITSPMIRVNAAIQKKIWKDKASIRFNADDIFHSWTYHNRSVSLKQAQYFQITESDTQRVGVSFSYRFGKSSFARKNKNNNDASDEEKGRAN